MSKPNDAATGLSPSLPSRSGGCACRPSVHSGAVKNTDESLAGRGLRGRHPKLGWASACDMAGTKNGATVGLRTHRGASPCKADWAPAGERSSHWIPKSVWSVASPERWRLAGRGESHGFNAHIEPGARQSRSYLASCRARSASTSVGASGCTGPFVSPDSSEPTLLQVMGTSLECLARTGEWPRSTCPSLPIACSEPTTSGMPFRRGASHHTTPASLVSEHPCSLSRSGGFDQRGAGGADPHASAKSHKCPRPALRAKTRLHRGSLAHLRQFLMHAVSHVMHQAVGAGPVDRWAGHWLDVTMASIAGCWRCWQTLGGEETSLTLRDTAGTAKSKKGGRLLAVASGVRKPRPGSHGSIWEPCVRLDWTEASHVTRSGKQGAAQAPGSRAGIIACPPAVGGALGPAPDRRNFCKHSHDKHPLKWKHDVEDSSRHSNSSLHPVAKTDTDDPLSASGPACQQKRTLLRTRMGMRGRWGPETRAGHSQSREFGCLPPRCASQPKDSVNCGCQETCWLGSSTDSELVDGDSCGPPSRTRGGAQS